MYDDDHVSRTPAELKIRSNFGGVHLLQIFPNKAVVHLLHYNSLFIAYFYKNFYFLIIQKTYMLGEEGGIVHIG